MESRAGGSVSPGVNADARGAQATAARDSEPSAGSCAGLPGGDGGSLADGTGPPTAKFSARERLGKELRDKYDAGADIRSLATAYGVSYGYTHKLLTESGATMRVYREGRRPSPATIAKGVEAARLRASGLPWREIAERIGTRDTRHARRLAKKYGHRLPHVIVAPEVARAHPGTSGAAGKRLGAIAGDLHLTPGEVSGVIRAAGGRP